MSCAKTGRPILTIYTSYDMFLHKELLFGGCDDYMTLKFLVALMFKSQLIT